MPDSVRRTGVLPRLPLLPRLGSGDVYLAPASVETLRALWHEDLKAFEAHLLVALRPWYVRLWEWLTRGE